jgi:hypothetical protein
MACGLACKANNAGQIVGSYFYTGIGGSVMAVPLTIQLLSRRTLEHFPKRLNRWIHIP